ncbi:PIG-L family deacetylase [Pseudomonas sp. OF001]|uniref:PIG-L deacetylase family protein n=1 Tax=Pseudomonas sp. OF001 TaxID=2772300 RepID=UPI0019184A55|nr:PIG-L deacetylase family protein [Pseudomonas sp. OF001]CAD5377032.1 PIG-L family deacetylase [Pseudomonas sp. OF001]
MLPFKNALVLAPHTDDGELGAGATIARLVDQGARVTYVAFSTAEQSVPEGLPRDILKTEVRLATASLGIAPENLIVLGHEVRKLNFARQDILEGLIALRRANAFDLVLMPSLKDIHQDHQTVALEGLRAFKGTTILGYELVWNNLSFDTTVFVKVSAEQLCRKVEALRQYQSQRGKDYTSEEFIFALARTRGVQIGAEYAESFEVVRWVMP